MIFGELILQITGQTQNKLRTKPVCIYQRCYMLTVRKRDAATSMQAAHKIHIMKIHNLMTSSNNKLTFLNKFAFFKRNGGASVEYHH